MRWEGVCLYIRCDYEGSATSNPGNGEIPLHHTAYEQRIKVIADLNRFVREHALLA